MKRRRGRSKEGGLRRKPPCQLLDLAFQPPELRENDFMLFKVTSVWYLLGKPHAEDALLPECLPQSLSNRVSVSSFLKEAADGPTLRWPGPTEKEQSWLGHGWPAFGSEAPPRSVSSGLRGAGSRCPEPRCPGSPQCRVWGLKSPENRQG